MKHEPGPPAQVYEISADSGFTLVELLVTMLVTALVLPVVLGLIGELMKTSQAQVRTTAAMQQEENAGQWLLQYLHGAVRVLPQSNATFLDVEIANGAVATGVNAGATEYATMTAQLSAAGPTGQFTITVTPQSGSAITETSNYAENVSDVFTYYYSSTTGGLSSTTTPTSTQLDTIVGIGVDMPFNDAVGGGQTITPTEVDTLQTTVYLQDSGSAPGTTVTMSNTTSGRTITATATVNVNATGSTANISDGTVTFAVAQLPGNTAVPVSCANQPVSAGSGQGTATCVFTVTAAGSYSVTGSFNGSAYASISPTPGTMTVTVS